MHSRGINIWLVGHSGMDRLCWEVWLRPYSSSPRKGKRLYCSAATLIRETLTSIDLYNYNLTYLEVRASI